MFRGSSPITPSSPTSKAHQKSGSFPPPALPGLNGRMTLSDSRPVHRQPRCRSRDLRPDGPPPITRITLPTCRAQYPGRPDRCVCRLLPCPHGLPRARGGSASALTLSRPAQASLALRPAGSLRHPRRPLSRGFDPTSYPAEPLVSFQINRQLSGWDLPPLVIRAFEAHSCPRHSPEVRRFPWFSRSGCRSPRRWARPRDQPLRAQSTAARGSMTTTACCPTTGKTSVVLSRPVENMAAASVMAGPPQQIQDRLDNPPQWPLARLPHMRGRRKERLQQRPLGIGQIAWQSKVRTGILRPSGVGPHR